MKFLPWKKKSHAAGTADLVPVETIHPFHDELDRSLEQFFGEPGALLRSGFDEESRWLPAFETSENDKEFHFRAELPGLDPQDLEVSISGEILTVSGQREEEHEERRGDFVGRRAFRSSFQRSFQLPAGADPQSAKARFDKGVLTLRIGKIPAKTARRIPVRAG